MDTWLPVDDTTIRCEYIFMGSSWGMSGRFQISVPANATITDARLRLVPAQGNEKLPQFITVYSGTRLELTTANYPRPTDFSDFEEGHYDSAGLPDWTPINSYWQHGLGVIPLTDSIQWYVNLEDYSPPAYMGFSLYSGSTQPEASEFYSHDYGSYGPQLYVEWTLPVTVAALEAEVGSPVWVYSASADNLYERRETDGDDEVILAEGVPNHTAWLQPGGRRYVAFDLDGDCQYIYYDNDTWSAPVLIRADRTDPAAIPLPASRDVMIVCKDSSNNLKLNLLRWNGSSYDVETEIDMGVTGNQTGDGWVQAGGNVYLAYTDTSDDLQTISSDLSGASWA